MRNSNKGGTNLIKIKISCNSVRELSEVVGTISKDYKITYSVDGINNRMVKKKVMFLEIEKK